MLKAPPNCNASLSLHSPHSDFTHLWVLLTLMYHSSPWSTGTSGLTWCRWTREKPAEPTGSKQDCTGFGAWSGGF